MRKIPTLLTILIIVTVTSCSGGGSPVEPTSTPDITTASSSTNSGQHCLLGYWDVFVDAERSSFEIIPLRDPQMHFNIVQPVEHTWKDSYFTVEDMKVEDDSLYVLIGLKHPYPHNIQYTAFDVRAIFISQADYTFPETDANIAYGDDVPRMLNPDGYTRLFNPVQFPEGLPHLLTYTRGELALGYNLTSTVNPYLAFCMNSQRRGFYPWSIEYREMYLHLPHRQLHIGYALDASWAQVTGPIIDPENQFPPEANSPEPYQMEFITDRELEPIVDSNSLLGLVVYDREGPDSLESVEIEAPDLFSGTRRLNLAADLGDSMYGYIGTIENELGADYGEYPVLAKIVDKTADPNLGTLEAFQLLRLRIKKGWARTFPHNGGSYLTAIATDSNDHIFAAGSNPFGGGNFLEDFDPGPGFDEHVADAYLVEYDSRGDYLRGVFWLGEITFSEMVIENSDIYLAGSFRGSVDFDPGPGNETRTAADYSSYAFVLKMSLDGAFIWVRTWGPCHLGGLASDHNGNIYTAGTFLDQVDFDPDPLETDILSPVSYGDAFLSCMDSEGDYKWARHWGWAAGNAVACDSTGTAYITGYFFETVDFDPGDGTDEHESNGDQDVFLSRFNSSGEFSWAKTWGGEATGHEGDEAIAIAIGNSSELYITGKFYEQADFDPGPGTYVLYADSDQDAFLSKFNTSGQFIWARNWGGSNSNRTPNNNYGIDVAIDNLGNVVVVGRAAGGCDFDPGPGTDIQFEGSSSAMFVSSFSSAGIYKWAQYWDQGGYVDDVATGLDNSVYLCGDWPAYLYDIDPTDGVDNWDYGGFILKLSSDGEY